MGLLQSWILISCPSTNWTPYFTSLHTEKPTLQTYAKNAQQQQQQDRNCCLPSHWRRLRGSIVFARGCPRRLPSEHLPVQQLAAGPVYRQPNQQHLRSRSVGVRGRSAHRLPSSAHAE